MAHPQIAAFARLARENTAPARLLAGQNTLLSRTMHDLRYDAVHDEFFVTNPFAQAILAFRGGADGQEKPIRVIQGPRTQFRTPDRLDVDTVHDEIIVPDYDSVLVFPRGASGDVAPIRVIRGPATELQGIMSLGVDPIHNVIVVPGRVGKDRDLSLLIFDRTAQGNVAPRAIIKGPRTGFHNIDTQLQIYSPRGWIIACVTNPAYPGDMEPAGTFIGVWSVNDNGDVPPRWKIEGPKGAMKRPRGLALNPKNKELIVADMRLNAVLTYYFPEIF